ncbi:MAG: Lon-like protease helical domain-containing protein, partial [Candidatus Sedimenticola endophacoides]
MEKALTPGQLYHRCDLGQFGFQDTSQIDGLERAVGQERALNAIDFGVGMEHGGYNLYVMGSTGLGRHTMVYEALRRQAEAEMAQSDWCYVSNFTDPSMPGALRLPAGTGRELSRDMRALVEGLIKDIPAALRSECRWRSKTAHIWRIPRSQRGGTGQDEGWPACHG